ncbi:MAG: hypothetical protein QXH51_06740 [Candidatus Bathyarchaeia archaeon]
MGIVITVRISDENVWYRFKNYVLAKYGKIHGALGEELTKAIRQYLEGKDVHTHMNGGSRRAVGELPELKKAILEKVQPGGSLPKRMLEDIIRKSSHITDRRSVEDRIKALVADGFLRREWEFGGRVFRVMGLEADKIR